jgi:hypothetical protein
MNASSPAGRPWKERRIMTTRSTRSAAVRVNVAGLVVAAAGILVQYFSGVEGFPTIPPGPFILLGGGGAGRLGAVALDARRRGAGAPPGFGPGHDVDRLERETTAPLSDPGEPAGFVGAVIQFLGLIVALSAGIVAVMHAPRVRTGA